MKNKTLTKNMPNVKWKEIPPVRGPNPYGIVRSKRKNWSYKEICPNETSQEGLTLMSNLQL